MELTREQVRTGILECLNQYLDLQGRGIQISDYTNVYTTIKELDELDCECIAGDINVLFDICMNQEEAHYFLNMPFNETVNFICSKKPTLGTTGRTPVLMGLSMGNSVQINDPDSMIDIDNVLLWKETPTYTLYRDRVR
ncbi:MAG: hypothetical protein J6T57_04160 [Alphaproteobacteria bacterium]|nr:hypothetical protein [Alphaproteobacteria bacterium]